LHSASVRTLPLLLVDLFFGPLERRRVLVPARNKGFDQSDISQIVTTGFQFAQRLKTSKTQ
jgi:hypothetical protein